MVTDYFELTHQPIISNMLWSIYYRKGEEQNCCHKNVPSMQAPQSIAPRFLLF